MIHKVGQNALVLSPHPDDESLGCGGTIKLITSAGGNVDVLFMTRGEGGFFPGHQPSPDDREQLAHRRQAEAKKACDILGVRRVAFLDGRDGMLPTQPGLYEPILRALEAHHYRSVFCPWRCDAHSDHAATHLMLREALRQYGREMEVWLYEVWAPLSANMFIAIDATFETKLQAVRAHESQVKLLSYIDGFTGLSRYRGLFCPPARHAEAFFNCDSAMLLGTHAALGLPQEQVPLVSR